MSRRNQHLQKLIDWAEAYNYQVFFDKNGGNNICLETKTIEISSDKNISEKIFILAHECGHIMNINRISPYSKNSIGEKKKINRLWDEVLAWVGARKLMAELNIPFNSKKLASYASKCLERYISAFSTQEEI